jgi:WD repeat-containing protein 35
MEKGRLHIVRDVTGDEPIASDGFICNFSDLKVKSILLDDIMRCPDSDMKIIDFVVDHESR